jgi:HlyD family secretion protein
MTVTRTRVVVLAVAAGVAALLLLALRPSPIRVEVARAAEGPLLVTVDEEGQTRAQDRFVVSSPVAGRLARVDFDDGDPIAYLQVLAVIDPAPLGPRERDEVIARVQAAEASKREANARLERARADHNQARRDFERAKELAGNGIISAKQLEQAQNAEATTGQELEAAKFRVQAAVSEVEIAKAGLLALEGAPGNGRRLVKLAAPVRGRVLRVLEKSERVVPAGTPLIVVGDPAKIEVVVDVLSTDAVKVRAGDPVLLEGWGGDYPIRAKVRLVEPYGFTKISALGIEEQRVNVIADFVDSPGTLGDGYRVEARMIIWQSDKVLKIPVSALFRHGEGWSVFTVEHGRAARQDVEVGHRNPVDAEITRGLNPDVQVILHPNNNIQAGSRVEVISAVNR